MDAVVNLVALFSLTGVAITMVAPAAIGAGMCVLLLVGMVDGRGVARSAGTRYSGPGEPDVTSEQRSAA